MVRARSANDLRRIADPIRRAAAAAVLMDDLRAAIAEAARVRHEAVAAAADRGMSRAAIARALGVSPQAITNLLNGH